MPSIQVCSARSRTRRWRRGTLRLPAKLLSPPALLGLWLLLSGLSAFIPRMFLAHRLEATYLAWEAQGHERGRAIVKAWTTAVQPPAFSRGNEPALEAWLEGEPLVRVLVDPGRGQVWVRSGNHLEAGALRLEDPARFLRWSRAAKASRQATWIPPAADYPEAMSQTSLLLQAGPWWAIKRWQHGSPEVEAFLGRWIERDSPFSFNLTRFDRDPEVGRLSIAGPGAPPRQGQRVFACMFPDLSQAFGDPWVVAIHGTRIQDAILEHKLRTWTFLAWGIQGLFVAVLGGGCLLQLYISRRERLRADQLAFLAHSLKTPLTILKLRCDTIRNAGLPKTVQDAQVARVGDEVDKLVKIIEAGLDGMKPRPPAHGLDAVGPAFFVRLKEQMEPSFSGEGRDLELDLDGTTFQVRLEAFRPALTTLLENALNHGKGAVRIRVVQRPRHVDVGVCDAGSGIPRARIQALVAASGEGGEPSSSTPPGQGVGIFLLHQMARHEGWGLRFDSVSGEGFSAVLEIPT